MGMTNEQYIETQTQIELLEGLVGRMNLDGFIAMIESSEALGPLLHPTEWVGAFADGRAERLGALKEMAKTLNQFKAQAIADQIFLSDRMAEAKKKGSKEYGEGEG